MGVSSMFTRMTNPEVYGTYNLINSIIGFLALLSLPGVFQVAVREFSRGRERIYTEGTIASFKSSLLAVILGLALTPFLFFFGYTHASLAPWIGAVLLIPAVYVPRMYIPYLYSQSRFALSSGLQLLERIALTTCVFVSLSIASNSLFFVVMSVLVARGALHLLWFFKFKPLYFDQQRASSENWLSGGIRLTIWSASSTTYDNADRIIVSALLGPTELALYVIASLIPIHLRVLLKESLRVFAPKIFRESSYDHKRLILLLSLLLSSTVAIVAYFLIPFVIRFVYSAEYYGSIATARVFLVTLPLASAHYMLTQFLIGKGREKTILHNQFIGIGIALIAYLVLIPSHGLFGAALGSIIYFTAVTILAAVFVTMKDKTDKPYEE